MADESPASASIVCPHCGQANRVAARFCRSCGQPLTAPLGVEVPAAPAAEPAPAEPPAPEGAPPPEEEPLYIVAETPISLAPPFGAPPSIPDDEPLRLPPRLRRASMGFGAWVAAVVVASIAVAVSVTVMFWLGVLHVR